MLDATITIACTILTIIGTLLIAYIIYIIQRKKEKIGEIISTINILISVLQNYTELYRLMYAIFMVNKQGIEQIETICTYKKYLENIEKVLEDLFISGKAIYLFIPGEGIFIELCGLLFWIRYYLNEKDQKLVIKGELCLPLATLRCANSILKYLSLLSKEQLKKNVKNRMKFNKNESEINLINHMDRLINEDFFGKIPRSQN